MNENNIKLVLLNIIKIYNKDTNEIFYNKNTDNINNNINFIKYKHKNSNTEAIYKLKVNDMIINKNNKFMIEYNCITCNKLNIFRLNNIVRKVNRNITKCQQCVNSCPNKINNQKITLFNTLDKKNNNNNININIDISNNLNKEQQYINDSNNEFNEEDSDFQDMYFSKHLTNEDFNRIKDKIISFQNDKFKNIQNFIYISNAKINNGTKYNPRLYDINRKVFEKPIYIKFKCENCENDFIHRDLYIVKNKYKILCKYCSLCNNSFKIRTFHNILNQKITYQSKLELNFIKKMNDLNILIENGPKINYSFNSKNRKYIVDFYIPSINTLVELKDDHIWHKEQIKNGIWKAKMDKIDELLKNNIYTRYLLIYPKNLMNNINIIKKYINNISHINILNKT
jgi:hypothetical protein